MNIADQNEKIARTLERLEVRLEIDEEIGKRIQGDVRLDPNLALVWELPETAKSLADEIPVNVTEILNFLEMWMQLESVVEGFDKEQKTAFSSVWRGFSEYRGFDGINEPDEKAVAEIAIDRMERFKKFRTRQSNSHEPIFEWYKAIYQAYMPLRKRLNSGGPLGADELFNILKSGSPQ